MPAWAGSDRRSRLPADWYKRRARVLRRDNYRCTWIEDSGLRCDEDATDVDHVVAGDVHDESNLRSLCRWHHNRKSGREGADALAIAKRRNANRFKRVEKHPGLIS